MPVWTKDLPTIEAHYWYRAVQSERAMRGLHELEMVKVFKLPRQGKRPQWLAETMRYLCPLNELDGEWSGPLWPPN